MIVWFQNFRFVFYPLAGLAWISNSKFFLIGNLFSKFTKGSKAWIPHDNLNSNKNQGNKGAFTPYALVVRRYTTQPKGSDRTKKMKFRRTRFWENYLSGTCNCQYLKSLAPPIAPYLHKKNFNVSSTIFNNFLENHQLFIVRNNRNVVTHDLGCTLRYWNAYTDFHKILLMGFRGTCKTKEVCEQFCPSAPVSEKKRLARMPAHQILEIQTGAYMTLSLLEIWSATVPKWGERGNVIWPSCAYFP